MWLFQLLISFLHRSTVDYCDILGNEEDFPGNLYGLAIQDGTTRETQVVA